MAMAMAINSTAQAMENMEYVRSLLEQRQPEFAAALEWAAMLAEKDSTEPTATYSSPSSNVDLVIGACPGD
jgi:hypothetical protein